MRCLSANPTMTMVEVAAEIQKSLSAVERASARLVKDGKLKYVGPQKRRSLDGIEVKMNHVSVD
nr:winged helix-turn-helix domain-containing protein [Polaromonas glacialis]